tara:strand:+ start:4 stop:1308 length:1305 start_codon:yes stop_codon:yes gene_type:complete
MGLITSTQQSYYNSGNFGGYQFTSLKDVIDNFMATYVGGGKLLENTNRADVTFHAMRAMQELSFDTFKSCKAQEIEVPPSLVMPIPQDYVNYVELSWSDTSGVKHIIYPTSKTSNPHPILQNSDGDYKLTATGTLVDGSDSITLDNSYTDIFVGMHVSAANIPFNTTVTAISTVSNITTITTSNNATYSGDETLTFSNIDGSLLMQRSFSGVVTGLSWTSGEDKIQASSSGNLGDLSIGMLVSHEDFATGTTIIDIQDPFITTSSAATDAGNSENVNFLSTDKISDTWSKYKGSKTTESNNDNYVDDTYWPMEGSRYGLDPQHAQTNGSYYIDCNSGLIHFSSNLSGKTVILDYISDGLGTDAEMQVHKFAEEAIYKWIAHGCLSAKIGIPEYIINRFKKERFAETRKAKLRLSNIKLEEITQILRGKSKQIKH